MTKTDHLAKAKDYIAKGEDYYRKAAEEIQAAKTKTGMSNRAIGDAIGKSESWVATLLRNVQHHDPDAPFTGGERAVANRERSTAKKVLREPEKRRRVLAELSHEERSEIVREVAQVSAPKPREGVDLKGKLDEAVAIDLSAQVAKLIAGASRIDLLLAERGAEFQRIDSETATRMDADLERVVNTIRDVRTELLKHREIEVAS